MQVLERVIPMDEAEAAFFLEQRENLRALMLAGALSIRGGSVEIHFDASAKIRKIEAHHIVYLSNK